MKNFRPMNIEEFNSTPGRANCMLFAFSQKAEPDKADYEYDLYGFWSKPVKEVIEEAALKFGLKIRKISSLNELPDNKYIIGVYVKSPRSEYEGNFEYHFVRRELDGTWVEKASWKSQDLAEQADLDALRCEFGCEPTFFVVEGIL